VSNFVLLFFRIQYEKADIFFSFSLFLKGAKNGNFCFSFLRFASTASAETLLDAVTSLHRFEFEVLDVLASFFVIRVAVARLVDVVVDEVLPDSALGLERGVLVLEVLRAELREGLRPLGLVEGADATAQQLCVGADAAVLVVDPDEADEAPELVALLAGVDLDLDVGPLRAELREERLGVGRALLLLFELRRVDKHEADAGALLRVRVVVVEGEGVAVVHVGDARVEEASVLVGFLAAGAGGDNSDGRFVIVVVVLIWFMIVVIVVVVVIIILSSTTSSLVDSWTFNGGFLVGGIFFLIIVVVIVVFVDVLLLLLALVFLGIGAKRSANSHFDFLFLMIFSFF
jgi:hypothetical protein